MYKPNFVMVPVQTLQAGDVVAVDGVHTRDAVPVAEVNETPEGTELVFYERAIGSDTNVRIVGTFPRNHPIALITNVDTGALAEQVEKWVSELPGD